MIKTTTREIASSSDVNAPVFYFKEYVRGLEYHNNGRQIDFVTDGNSLYVPSTDNVTACKDSIKEDGGFMRLVSEGKPGIQGLKGDPGRDGRTPSVFARFDGRQMIFYTNEINEDGTPKIDDKGNPVTRRIAATNDLTGPSWRPKKVDDTIIWEKTRDDSQPESINLSDLVKETAPVIFRVDSDNTKRSDETSGPANYIQWKYEGDEYWNNLISISELMNLALAGVCIWFDETDQEYHLGHRQVLHATYDSSKSGKRIISDVEHGDVLYDAGPIHLPDFEADIAALWEEVCALKDRVDAIEEELPKFVKAVIFNDKLNKPDEDGVVDLGDYSFYTKEESDERFQPKGDYQPAGDYIKKSDLKFEVRNEEDGRFLYVSFENGAPGTWNKVFEATCVCKKEEDPTIYYTIFFETPTPSTATMTYSGTVKYPGSKVKVPAGTTVVLEADAEGYKHYKETKLINADYHFKPVLTKETAPDVKYSACVIDKTDLADKIYIGTTSANKQQACLENLSNGTTVYGKATRRGHKDKNVSGVINNDDLELHITGEWIEEEPVPVVTLSVDPTRIELPATPNEQYYVTVTTNAGTYSFQTNECGWYSLNKTGNRVLVQASANTNTTSRTCEFYVIAGDKTETVTVYQEGKKEEPVETYTVTPNKDEGTCTDKPDHLYIKKSTDIDYVETAITGLTESNTINVKATKRGKKDKKWDVAVSEDTLIYLGMDGSTCTWKDEEVTPTKYEVSIGNTCDASTAYLTKTEGGSSIGQTYQAEEDEIVWLHAEKSGKKTINKPSDMIKDNYSFVINCDEWKDETEPEVEVTGISLDNSTMSLTYASCDGHTYGTTSGTLTATITPSDATNKNVNWTTNNSSVATVSRGVVTAKGVGTAIITATAVGNTSKTATCRVTVTAASVSATGISLNKQTTTLTVGSTETLEATLTPSCATGTVTWSSNDTGVATVSDSGKVTAVNPGTATITAKVNGKPTTCTIIVSASPIATYHVDVNWISGCEPDSYYVTTDKSSSAREEEIDAPEGSTVYLIANKRGYVQYETSIENISGPHTFEPPCSIWASVTINNCIGNDMSTSEDSAEHVRNLYASIDNVDASNDNIEWRVEPVGDTPGNATVEPYVDDARKDCGRVTALGAGVVEVFAKSKRNGNEDSCVINIVEEDPIMVSAVTIDPLNMEISVSDTSTSRLRAIVSGTGNYNKAVTWNVTKDGASTDGLTLTPGSLDESGNYTAEIKGNVAGQYTVRAISVQDTNISGQCTILVLGETKNVRLINNSPWTVNYSVGNSSSAITASDTKELGTVSEDMTIQRVYPDQAKTYFTLENGTNTYSQSGNMSDSYSGDNWIISYADLQSGDIIIDYETGIGPILP